MNVNSKVLLTIIAFIAGTVLGKIIWQTSSISNDTCKDVEILNPQIEERSTIVRSSPVKLDASSQNIGPQQTVGLQNFTLSQLKNLYETKSNEVRKNLLESEFPPAKNNRERNDRKLVLTPEITALIQEGQTWLAEWSLQLSKEIISLKIIWSIHEDLGGFGVEIFLPDMKQILSMGTSLDFATPKKDDWYVVTSIDDKDIEKRISHIAFTIPKSRSKMGSTEYLVPEEKVWQKGPEILWQVISQNELERMRGDSVKRNERDEPD